MGICIVTNDNVLARFLILELAEAGFAAEQALLPNDKAGLNIIDLDFSKEPFDGDFIGFSYGDAAKSKCRFLPRPISVPLLITAVSEMLMPEKTVKEAKTVILEKASRKIKTDAGEVRLSEKETSLLVKLCEASTLSREAAAEIFGGGESNVVDVYIHYLRKKLKKICPFEIILSKRGEGYALGDMANVVIQL